MIFWRSLIFNIGFYALLIVLMILGLPVILTGRARARRWARLWARLSLLLLEHICQLKVEFRGLERLPKGAALIAAKHQSFLETFALLVVIPEVTFVVKRELTFIPLFGWYLSGTGQIAINRAQRSGALSQVAKAARTVFAQNRQLLIFPEGTRRPVGARPAYRGGIALVEAETKMVCVPVALNTGLFWPRRQFSRRPGTAVIEFLPPIAPGLEKSAFMHRVEDVIETATARLVAEACNKDPSLSACIGTTG